MRRLIESFTPDGRRFYWLWVGGVFVLYLALMVAAAGVFVSHQSSRSLAHEADAIVTIERKLPASSQASIPTRQIARYY
jgi:hypothetical protein